MKTITSLAYEPHGEFLAAGRSGGTITLWDLGESKPLATTLRTTVDFISSLVFSPDGRILASAGRDDAIQLWDSDRSSATFGQPLGAPLGGHTDNIWALAFHPSGELLASAGEDGEIRLWELIPDSTTFRLRAEDHQRAPGGPIYALAFSPDGKHLASGGQNDLAILWDMELDNSLFQELINLDLTGRPWNVVFNPEQDLLAVQQLPQFTLVIYDMNVSSPTYLQPLELPTEALTVVIEATEFSPDGKVLASANLDRTIQLADGDPASARFGQPLGVSFRGHTAGIWMIDFHPDGKILASASLDDTLRLWNMDGSPIQTVENRSDCWHMQFSPDGSALALGCRDGIQIWDIKAGPAFGTRHVLLDTENRAECTRELEYSPDGKNMASAGCDNTIRIWDVDRSSTSYGQQIGQPLLGHQDVLTDLAYSPSGRYLASSDNAGKIYIWDMNTRKAFSIPVPGIIEELQAAMTVIFSPDERQLTAVFSDGRVFRINFDLEAWIAQACSRANRNLTEEEWREFFGDEPYRPTCPEIPAQ